MSGRLEIATPGNPTTNTPAITGCDFLDNNNYDEAGDGEWITMSFFSWPNAAAYLDWAGLRPFTELEYEKACRGPLLAVLNEYAWGTDQIASGGLYTFINGGLTTQAVSNMSSVEGNALYKVTAFGTHIRGGIFATATSTRINAGAGYYVAMELSGSVDEFCVSTTNVAGRSFTGKHGDGNINVKGMADVDYWPGLNSNIDINSASSTYQGTIGVTQSAGVTVRGGNLLFTTDFHNLTISKRTSGSMGNFVQVYSGIRGVRDAN